MKRVTSNRRSTHQFVPKNALVAGLEDANNLTTTENAALAYKSTLSAVLDFFGNAGALRKREDSEVINLFIKAFIEDRLLALKTLFYIRDVRGGQGERKTFRTILRWLADRHSEVVRKNINNVAFYGRWDDLYVLMGSPLEKEALSVIAEQLSDDIHKAKLGKPISLLAKWLKSENTSSSESRALAYKTRKYLRWTPKRYRKTLSALRAHIDVVEIKMCSGEWNNINFEHVPSQASRIYRKAFGKNAQTSYAKYLGKVERGEAKINAATLYPYDILRSVVEGNDTQLSLKAADLQWRALPNYLEGDGKGLVIADTSGSMSGLPIYVAVSLAMYFAERNVGPFKDVFLTFSEHPCFHRLVGDNIREKWQNLDQGGWDMNTNLQAALDLILSTAVKNKVAQKDMPSMLYIVSDMQFDQGCRDNHKTNYEVIKDKFERAGYKMPQMVWWQVDSRQNNVPVKFNDVGCALVSGSHPSILKKITNMKMLSPLGLMLEAITDERYDRVAV